MTLEGDEITIRRITTNVKDGKLVIDVGRDEEKLSAGFDFLFDHDFELRLWSKI